MNPVVVACAGPSLLNTPIHGAGCPIAAISTAIRVVQKPKYWIFVDRPNPKYGSDKGVSKMLDPDIVKVTQASHLRLGSYPNIHLVPYERDNRGNRAFMDGKPALVRVTHLSVLFAIQWLIKEGYDRLIFAGMDLSTSPEDPYAYKAHPMSRQAVKGHNDNHNACYSVLKEWHLIAKTKGVSFVSWTPSPSRINEFMDSYGG